MAVKGLLVEFLSVSSSISEYLRLFRPFAVVPIPSSNLILMVAENWCPGASDNHFKITTTPFEHEYNNESLACYRSTVYMRRRRPTSCINRHANVSVCGGSLKLTTLQYWNDSNIYRKVRSNTVAADTQLRPV